MPPEIGSPVSQGPGRMQGFVADLLRQSGALVEPIAPEGLEVLAPPAVQRALGLGELARLGFGAAMPPGAQRVGIEGDWLERFAGLLGDTGRWTRRVVTEPGRAPNDPERMLGHELVLDNATYRLLGISAAWTRYVVMDFRASAVSNDKRDFMLRVAVNLATGALADAVLPSVEDGGGVAPDEDALPPRWERSRLLDRAARALQPRLEAALEPFVTGLRRRLGRDQDRLHTYHNDLHREAMLRILALPADDPRRQREEQRAAAIGREYRAKLDDLARQYAARVTVAWVQTQELIMPVHRFSVQIRRRKGERTIQLDLNALARRLEPPPCEFSFSTDRPRLVCDDALHLVGPAGMAPCRNCGRVFCRACHPGECPKCRFGAEVVGKRLF